ncbi:MAG: hypothetical protein KKE17_03430 [Proteobacteria bacterium]|nr:hypothetical protein [Pseudomonadota bacterium]
MKDIKPFNLDGLKTYSIHDRPSKVTIDHFAKPLTAGATIEQYLQSLPAQLMGVDFPDLVERIAKAHLAGKPVIVGMGAHVIKVGLNPLLIDLMEKSVITGLAMNGACIVHDTEIAISGQTSEEVEQVIGSGAFGAAKETGEIINEAIRLGAEKDKGLGEAVGEYLVKNDFPHNNMSLLANAYRLNIPVTVHVALGTDIVHIHPTADGAAIGKTSMQDFKRFCTMVADLDQGVYLNIGSAVILPEVFLKALTVVRNHGHQVNTFTTANFDFIRQYRPMTNVVNRPTAAGGKGFNITGHHELMIPLLIAAVLGRINN